MHNFNRSIATVLLVLLCATRWCAAADAGTLTLERAVELALKNQLPALLAEERVKESRGRQGLTRSALLPNLSASASQSNLTANLAALGLGPGSFPGINPFIGPYNRFDARFQLIQSVFNLESIRRYRSSRYAVQLAQEQQRLVVQQVTTATAFAYIALLEARDAVSAAEANVQLAQRLFELATNQKNAGVATGLDVVRAETRLTGQQVQLEQARTNLDTARLNLLRLIGAPLGGPLEPADQLKQDAEAAPEPEAAVQQALGDRVELKVAELDVRIADSERKAAIGGWMPSVSFYGDYGSSGLKPNEVNLPTRTVGIKLDVPIFDGGRTRSEVQIAASRLRQAELQRNDYRAAVEKDVRQALDNLRTREQQVKAANKNLDLAQRELSLAQDRFRNGVADNIEVTNAQTALENARQLAVSSLAQLNVARLNLASAQGRAETFHL